MGMASKQINLYVNNAPIEMDFFVQGYVDRVISGILLSLKGTCRVRNLDLSVERDVVNINLNGSEVPVNDFVNKIIKNTVLGMVTSLKGVGEVKKLKIEISR
jgi:hypothetical protein